MTTEHSVRESFTVITAFCLHLKYFYSAEVCPKRRQYFISWAVCYTEKMK